jgi:hypothetical protein
VTQSPILRVHRQRKIKLLIFGFFHCGLATGF